MSDPAGFLEPVLGAAIPWLYADSPWWTALGLVGNGLFGSRFFIQWLHSERKQQLIVPPVFWHQLLGQRAVAAVRAACGQAADRPGLRVSAGGVRA